MLNFIYANVALFDQMKTTSGICGTSLIKHIVKYKKSLPSSNLTLNKRLTFVIYYIMAQFLVEFDISNTIVRKPFVSLEMS